MRPIYLDNHSTTPTDSRVAAVVMHYMTTAFGNSSSIDHSFGDEAEQAVRTARREVARLAGSSHRSIVFTSGSTEAINLALQGLAYAEQGGRTPLHIGVSPTEHKAVLDTAEALTREGRAQLTWFRVDDRGRLDLDDFERACRAGLHVACVMAANNEIGTVAPMDVVGGIAAAWGVTVVCDATQALGRIPFERDSWNLAFVAVSAHKLYGPKGIGALVMPPEALIRPLLHGGGHERGLRSGTLNVPAIAGFGEACRLRGIEMFEDETRIASLRDELQSLLLSAIPDIVVNGALDARLPGNLHFSVPGVPNSALVARLREKVAFSTGAACSSRIVTPSHVLKAIGLPEQLIGGAIRLGLGKFTTREEVSEAALLFARAVEDVRRAMAATA